MSNAKTLAKKFSPIRNLFAEGRKLRFMENYLSTIRSNNVTWLTRDINGIIDWGSSVCFGNTAGRKFTNFAFIIGPKFDATFNTPETKKMARKYLNYVFKRSIFSKYYKNTNVSDALKYGFEIDCHNAPRSLMLCALAAVRSCWERRSAEGFNCLLKLGFDEHRAFILSSYLKKAKDNHWFMYASEHSHTIFTNLKSIDFKRAMDGNPRNPNGMPICRTAGWGGAHAQFQTAAGTPNTIPFDNIEHELRDVRGVVTVSWANYSAYDFNNPETCRRFFEAYNNAITTAYNA